MEGEREREREKRESGEKERVRDCPKEKLSSFSVHL